MNTSTACLVRLARTRTLGAVQAVHRALFTVGLRATQLNVPACLDGGDIRTTNSKQKWRGTCSANHALRIQVWYKLQWGNTTVLVGPRDSRVECILHLDQMPMAFLMLPPANANTARNLRDPGRRAGVNLHLVDQYQYFWQTCSSGYA